jgi:hypothetical protein
MGVVAESEATFFLVSEEALFFSNVGGKLITTVTT